MSRDSNGNYSLPPGYLAVTGQKVLASQHNGPLEDVAAALTGSLPRNGSAPMNANLPMAGFKITGLGDGTAAGDAFTRGQFDAALVARLRLDAAQVFNATQQKQGQENLGVSDGWAGQPIGVPIPLLSNLAGTAAPPKDKGYRYVLLTAGESGAGKYNEGILTTQSVTGSAPLVVATAVISLTGSPINGQTINLINTERRFLRAGSAGTVENDAFQGHQHTIAMRGAGPGAYGGPFAYTGSTASGNLDNSTGAPETNGANGTPRTSTETRPKSIGVTYYMRIK